MEEEKEEEMIIEKIEKKKESNEKCVEENCSEHLKYPIRDTESGYKKTEMTDKLVHLCQFAQELI